MINKVILLGHLGADPELIVLESQQAICRMRLATSSPARGEDGSRRTEWHTVVAFGRTALRSAEYLRSGALVYVEGRIQSREYADKDGVQHKVSEIVASTVQFLGSPKGREKSAQVEVCPVEEPDNTAQYV